MPTKAQLTKTLKGFETLVDIQTEKIKELKEENGIIKMGTMELVSDLKETLDALTAEKEDMKKIINTKLSALDQELKVRIDGLKKENKELKEENKELKKNYKKNTEIILESACLYERCRNLKMELEMWKKYKHLEFVELGEDEDYWDCVVQEHDLKAIIHFDEDGNGYDEYELFKRYFPRPTCEECGREPENHDRPPLSTLKSWIEPE